MSSQVPEGWGEIGLESVLLLWARFPSVNGLLWSAIAMAFPSKLILCWLSPCHEFHILQDRARITKTDGNYRLCFCRIWFSSSLDETWMSQANVNTELFICRRRTNKAKVLKLKGKIRMTPWKIFCRKCNKKDLLCLMIHVHLNI